MLAMVISASDWAFDAKIIPLIVGSLAIFVASLSLITQIFFRHEEARARAGGGGKMHMDVTAQGAGLPNNVKLRRGAEFFGWLIGLMISMATIGLIPSIPLFVLLFMRLENREPWKLVLPQVVVVTLVVYFLFDQLLAVPWPPTLLGEFFPQMKFIPSV